MESLQNSVNRTVSSMGFASHRMTYRHGYNSEIANFARDVVADQRKAKKIIADARKIRSEQLKSILTHGINGGDANGTA